MSVTILEIPPGIPSDGTVKVAWVPDGGFADYTAPTLAELQVAGVTDLSCLLMQDGFGEEAEEGTNTDRRLCSKQAYTLGGTVTWTIQDLRYVYDVQNPESPTNAAYAALAPGTKGFLVARWGKDAAVDFAGGDVIDVFPAELGVQRKQAPEANSELKVLQRPRVTGNKVTDVTLLPAA